MEQQQDMERYSRQILLEEIGAAGQARLAAARVLVAGAGGLGCPALQYLAAAGVGTLAVVDGDTVALSNLQRQLLYTVADIGQPKATCAVNRLKAINPDIRIEALPFFLTTSNALEIMQAYDIIIDGTDNFAARYLINDACVLLGKPLVYGAVSRFEGQVAVFNNPGEAAPANYRDLFPQAPRPGEVRSCSEAGVLGVLPGIIGTLQATETIKMITGAGHPLTNRVLTFNALNNRFFEVQIQARPETPGSMPADEKAFRAMDYDWLCGSRESPDEIDAKTLEQLLQTDAIVLVDLREPGEGPEFSGLSPARMRMTELETQLPHVRHDTLVFLCQSGIRSLEAVRRARSVFGNTRTLYSLRGGVLAWNQYCQVPTE